MIQHRSQNGNAEVGNYREGREVMLISLFNSESGRRERSLLSKYLQMVKALLWRGLLQVVVFFPGLATAAT